MPPQQPSAPGHPGPGGPPRRTGRLALIIGASVTAVALLATGGALVWNLSGSRPYADLPSCRRLLPSEFLDSMPETEGLGVDGDYEDGEDLESLDQENLLGYLWCDVEDGGEDVMSVTVYHMEYEDDGAAVEDMLGETEEFLEDLENGDWEEELEADIVDWRPSAVGDGGAVVLYEPGYLEEDAVYGFASFSTVNLDVTVFRVFEGGIDAEEELDSLDDLADRVHRQLSRESERA
ncbi:hypothetical protein KIK06_28885 [Nocardiopsis sp. EMB25]|uniref:hypothetical protein n=1 Tax=Nocardiopsis sp. EMB25 TaxID=2835867 RepID=UPI00228348BE|nr:hypothetical protein [Nocardiopsis sp. EMB25]MCY9787900.1 hypothetical protein [Nocardiopsis sp. EMB25]